MACGWLLNVALRVLNVKCKMKLLLYILPCRVYSGNFCNCVFYSAKIATAAHRTLPDVKKQNQFGINTSPTLKAIFYSASCLVFYLPSLRDAYKKSQLCKSSFVLSAPGTFHYVRSVFHSSSFLHRFLVWHLASTLVG